MAWSDIPTLATPFGRYDRYIQLWRAVRERVVVTADHWRWPEGNIAWYEGTITSLTADTLTDSAQTWPNSWYGWVQPPGSEHLPAFYTVVIDPDAADPWDVIVVDVRAAQTGNDLPIEDITDYVTAGWIASIASLLGKPYAIISGAKTDSGFGLWWSDRWPVYPNDREDWKGTVSSATTSTLTETNASIGPYTGLPQRWTVDQWAGKDLLVNGSDGFLHRVSIVSNTADTLTFATQAWTATGAYVIVAAGDRAWPGRARPDDLLDYGGYSQSWYSNHPDDTLTGTSIAAASITIEEYNASTAACETSSRPIFDVGSFFTRQEPPADCEPYDKLWTPNFYKALRAIQVELETLCSSFIEAKSYNGAGAIPNFTLATWLKKADINWSTSSVAGPDGAGDYHFSVSSTYYSTSVHWAIINSDMSIADDGTGTADAAGKVTLGPGYVNDAGKSIVYSAGWTRPLPRMVRFMFERTGFIPDVDLGAAVDPPVVVDFALSGSLGVGTWTVRGASTAYAEYDQYGSIGDTGGAFVVGEVARFVGDNWMDGGVGAFARQVGSGSTADLPYYHNFAVAVHPEAAQEVIVAQESGSATSGSTITLTDTAQDWWTDWYGGGVLRTESGTATAGSTTSLTDSSKDITLEAGQFWIPGRFAGFDPYVGFIVEVQAADLTWHKRPIATCTFTSDVPTITWTEALAFSASGRPWRIREPKYELNRWKGRKATITKPDGTAYTVVVTHSDDETLWFAAVGALTAEAADRYQILDPKPGTTWKRRAAGGAVLDEWEEPTGTDSRGVDWRDPSNNNQPTVITRYGKLQRHDYAYAFIVWDELYRAINALRWTKQTPTWTSRAVDGVAENNEKEGSSGFQVLDPTDANTCPTLKGDANTAYAAAAATENDGTAPTAFTVLNIAQDICEAHLTRRYAYAKITGTAPLLARTVEFLAYSVDENFSIPAVDTGVPATSTNGSYYTYDTSTDDVIQLAWSSFGETATPTMAGTVRQLLGDQSLAAPNFGSCPPVQAPDANYNGDSVDNGYNVTGVIAIEKWDVTGGLTYVD